MQPGNMIANLFAALLLALMIGGVSFSLAGRSGRHATLG